MYTESIEVAKRNIYAWKPCKKDDENGQFDCRTYGSPAATGLLRGEHPPSGSLYIYIFKFTLIITYKFDLRAQILIVILHGATETVF